MGSNKKSKLIQWMKDRKSLRKVPNSDAMGRESFWVAAGLGEKSIPDPSPLGLWDTGYTSRYSLECH